MDKKTVLICHGTACLSAKSSKLKENIEAEIQKLGLTNVSVKLTGCHGFCQRGPIVIIEPEGIFYSEVTVEDATEIVNSHLKNNIPVERLFYKTPGTTEKMPFYKKVDFYAKQQRIIILRNCGHINPERIDDYLNVDGYKALQKVLTKMDPKDVIKEISASNLRGRGGAGFPTGKKWGFCHNAPGDKKYIICNADEGDPGAFMDRSILEADPHSVIEGLIIAGFAIGANEAYIYIRAEYPLAVKRIRHAIDQASEQGLIGENVQNSGFNFQIHVMEGAGAFVCGEETALIASIEGKSGTPSPKPPFPANKGLWSKPTTINNVKTLASIPVIINKGANWFANIGSKTSKGTAVFALTGHIANCGLVEVAMGTTLRKIIFGVGGGIATDHKFKAVQTGGPSGGCLPETCLDTPVDFDTLTQLGSIMGSGGMVVMDDSTCMVDVARYFLDFTQKESCGKCAPCRLGTKQMLDILTNITEGKGKPDDLQLLEELCDSIKIGSLCGLGQTAPNPVASTLKYFRAEYEAHIHNKSCPTGTCKALMHYEIQKDLCIGCHRCAKACPVSVIKGEIKQPHTIDEKGCIKCGACYDVCPLKPKAVKKVAGQA